MHFFSYCLTPLLLAIDYCKIFSLVHTPTLTVFFYYGLVTHCKVYRYTLTHMYVAHKIVYSLKMSMAVGSSLDKLFLY